MGVTSIQTTGVARQTNRSVIADLVSQLPELDLHADGSQDRLKIEQYITRQFRLMHGARVNEYLPQLLTLRTNGNPQAVVGLRAAQAAGLFLECYLDKPVEQVISEATAVNVKREEIYELGNLVATERGSSYLLFIVLTAVLNKAGVNWVAFTATPQVEKSLRRLGFEFTVLANATVESLPPESQKYWGRYYESSPRVIAGKVKPAMEILIQNPTIESFLSLYQNRVAALAGVINHWSLLNETHSFAA